MTNRSPIRWFRAALRVSLETPLRSLPPDRFVGVIMSLVRRRLATLPPEDAIRLLMKLDAELYPFHGRHAVLYGGGIHPKHEMTGYHEFFIRNVTAENRILDIGCGIGALARDIAERTGAKITGIDLEKKHIEIANARHSHPNVTYVHGDALKDLPAGEYDTIILSNVMEHLPGRPAFLRSVQERLRPKRYLIRVPLYERDWRVPLKDKLGIDYRLDPTHETEFTQESFRKEIDEAGLKIVSMEIRWSEIWAVIEPV